MTLMGLRQALIGLCALWLWILGWRIPLGPLMRKIGFAAMSLSGFLLFFPWVGFWALEVFFRGLVLASSCLVLASSVPALRVVASIQWLLPAPIVAFLAILARHLGIVREEVLRLHRATVLRGGYRTWRNRVRSWKIMMIRLLPLVLIRADRVADQLGMRGFRGYLPVAEKSRLTSKDAIFLVLMLTIFVAGVGM